MTDLELSVLGPLSATRGNRALDLRGPRQRAVLAVLIAAAPATVPVDDLLTQAWPADAAPVSGTLHHYISRLRGELEPAPATTPSVVVRRGNGYALAVPADAVDATRFTALAARGAAVLLSGGDPRAAAELLSSALGLWRGAAYAEVADLDALAPVVARLTEVRTAATEDLIDALLRSGRTAEAIGRAREHTAGHPLRERGWELLALSLYRAGRQAEALAALRTVRHVLAEELGLDPGPGLVAVEAEVRAQTAPTGTAATLTALPAQTVRSLPVPLGDLVGRDAETNLVDDVLDRARLVTLTGPGGVGKTRLALAVGHLRAARGQEVALVEVEALDDPELLAPTVGAALGIPGAPDERGLADALTSWTGLLVLDNCEHLVADVARLATALLGSTTGMQVLATSREVLDVAGERTVQVLPLESEKDAVELFVRRVRAVAPDWEPDPDEGRAVRRICADLDGLPLALELAAARTRVLSVEQLADALDEDRFAVLGQTRRDAPRSQRGLERTVEWGYRALGAEERTLFRRLSVFASDVDLAAASAVLGSPGGARTGATLASVSGLVRRSLLQVRPGPGPRRFRMLETLRRYALDRMDADELADARLRHRRYVATRVQDADRLLRGPEAADALAGLRRDRAEHRAALASAAAAEDTDTLLDLAAGLSWSWYRGGDLTEGRRALLRAVEPAEPGVGDARRTGRVARALVGLGKLHYLAGEPDAARAALERATGPAGLDGDPGIAVNADTWRAHVLTFLGEHATAMSLARDAVARAESVGEGWLTAEAFMVLGMAGRVTGAGGDPRPALSAAVAAAEGAGYAWAAVSSSWALMKAAADADDLDGALAAAGRMHEPLLRDGDVTSWLVLVHSTAAVLARTGRAEDAGLLAGAVDALGSRVGFSPARMDPVDGPREAAAVREALGADSYARAVASGRNLSRSAVDDLLRSLLP